MMLYKNLMMLHQNFGLNMMLYKNFVMFYKNFLLGYGAL